MELNVVAAANGLPTLKVGEDFLEDPIDPVEGARAFVDPKRLEEVDVVVLFGVGLGYRVEALKGLNPEQLVVYEPNEAIADVAKSFKGELFEDVALFTDHNLLLNHLCMFSATGDETLFLVPPAYSRNFTKEHQKVVQIMTEAEAYKQVRKNSVRDRYPLIIKAGLTNVPQLAQWPLALEMGKPLTGCPAFVVAAGPSLDKNAHLLAQAQHKGAIFTVNTASPVLEKVGAKIDILTCIEAIDATDALTRGAPNAKLLAFDLSTHPNNLAVQADRKAIFFTQSQPFYDIATRLGTQTLVYGSSVATTALALAVELGADPVVLLGQDIAYTDGKVYAKGTGREHMTAVTQDNGALRIEYGEEYKKKFTDHGIKGPSEMRLPLQLDAWGGGKVTTTHDLAMFLRWYEAFASIHKKDGPTLINATEGGVHIEGFHEMTLADVLAELPERQETLLESYDATPPLPMDMLEKVRDDIVEECNAIQRAVRKCAKSKRGSEARIRGEDHLKKACNDGFIIKVDAAPELIKVRDDKEMPMGEREKKTFGAIEQSTQRVRSSIEAALPRGSQAPQGSQAPPGSQALEKARSSSAA